MLRFFLLGFANRFQHAAHAGAIDGDGLFAEHMLAGGDGGGQMSRAKVGRGGQDDHVDIRVHHLLVGVETGKAVIVVDGEAVAQIFRLRRILDVGPTALQAIFKQIRHRRELDVVVRPHGVHRRTAAPPAAADQADL